MPAKPVEDEPEVDVHAWAFVCDRSLGAQHEACRLIAFRTDSGHGRMSSPVVEFDSHACTVRTASGRLYRLHGEPDHVNAWRALMIWCGVHAVPAHLMPIAKEDDVALACAPAPSGPAH